MNLQEYVNQKDPQPLLNGSVKVTAEDLKFYGSTLNKLGLLIEIVYLKAVNYSYVVVAKSGMLYTMDENGMPSKETVFSLIK